MIAGLLAPVLATFCTSDSADDYAARRNELGMRHSDGRAAHELAQTYGITEAQWHSKEWRTHLREAKAVATKEMKKAVES